MVDNNDTDLTAWGRALVAEMNHVGMVPDGSHCSVRTGLDLCVVSTAPVDSSYTRWGPIEWMPPETFIRLGEHLRTQGWKPDDIRAVLGGNFRRVAQHSWTQATTDENVV